ncbi:MAG: CPBP family intramembrane metalloprotease [Clostridiales bacterium]|nr:CPBP family intramembrane metalloprotease [Clostridiales bacterium]
MLSFTEYVISAVLQIVVLSLIPFIWWLITARKKEGFLALVGIKKPVVSDGKKWLITMAAVYVVLFVVGQLAILLRGSIENESDFIGMGAAAIPSIIVCAVFQTALSEEIFFRGFLLKRLTAKFGFFRANIIQAVLFGAAHLIILLQWDISLVAGIVIVVYPMLSATVLSYVNEKLSGGSIIPSWIIHGCLNLLEYLILAF